MDYFPHDCDSRNDLKIRKLRAVYGNDGYATYFILLENIYRQKHYELEIMDEETILILSEECKLDVQNFKQILLKCIDLELFDKKAYEERKVLTSDAIKKRTEPIETARNRKREWSNSKGLGVMDVQNTGESTQSKVKESKVKESKVKESKVKESKEDEEEKETSAASEPIVDLNFKKVIDVFNQNIHPVTPIEAEKIKCWLKNFETDAIIMAIQEAVENNARTIKYIEAILNSWNSKGLKTKSGIEAYIRDRQKKKNDKQQVKPNARIPTAASNQRKYDGDELEKMLLERNKGSGING